MKEAMIFKAALRSTEVFSSLNMHSVFNCTQQTLSCLTLKTSNVARIFLSRRMVCQNGD